MKLKICSLNLHGFKGWDSREPKIIDYLGDVKPDVILFQEVVHDLEYGPYNQIDILNKALLYEHVNTSVSRLYISERTGMNKEGLGILSKLPIHRTETLVLNKQPDDKHNRIVQMVDLNLNGTEVKLANVHFTNRQHLSRLHLQELIELLNQRNEERVIAGDFNMYDIADNADLYADKYTASTDFKKYISYPEKQETLDYILIPKTYEFETLETHDGNFSDHSALLTDIRSK